MRLRKSQSSFFVFNLGGKPRICKEKNGKEWHDLHRDPTHLSNWGKEAWKKKKIQGFNGIRTRNHSEYRPRG